MEIKYYFAYGSNTNLTQMAARCPTAEVAGVVCLHGYRLVMRGVADIEKAKGCRTIGVLFTFDREAEARLDIYEGFPFAYLKREVTVVLNNKLIKATTYTMQVAGHKYRPNKEYYDLILQGYQQNGIVEVQLNAACDFGKGAPYSDRKSRRIVQYSANLNTEYSRAAPLWADLDDEPYPAHSASRAADKPWLAENAYWGGRSKVRSYK